MILPYLPRLLCLGLAFFFLVHMATALVTLLFVPLAMRTAQRLAPRSAARLLLTLRLLPLGLATLTVLGLCVPSYLWFEPQGIEERTDLVCLLMGVLGFVVCGTAIARGTRAAVRSCLFIRSCRRSGYRMPVSRKNPPAFVIRGPAPFLALAGIVRPQLVISERVVDALSEEELSVVLRHERAHRASWDNLKRLCICLSPGFTPLLSGFEELERRWMAFAEYAADEAAVGGDARRSVALASALVQVARLGTISRPAPVAISFLEDVSGLSARVDRLLAESPSRKCSGGPSWRKIGWAAIVTACLVPVLFKASTFALVQSLLERLNR